MYFQELRNSHQTHYEQFGTMKGSIEIDKVSLISPIYIYLITDSLLLINNDMFPYLKYILRILLIS